MYSVNSIHRHSNETESGAGKEYNNLPSPSLPLLFSFSIFATTKFITDISIDLFAVEANSNKNKTTTADQSRIFVPSYRRILRGNEKEKNEREMRKKKKKYKYS